MIRGGPSQVVGAQMISVATGGSYIGTVTVHITIDGGIQTTGSVNSGICTDEGFGFYTYFPTEAETDGIVIAFTFTGTGALNVTTQCFTVSDQLAGAA